MCFNQPMSIALSCIGLIATVYAHYETKNKRFVLGVFYFFLMEFLQVFQYSFIDQCDSKPYFAHLSLGSDAKDTKENKTRTQYDLVLRLCLVGGSFMFSRYIFGIFGFAKMHPPRGTSSEWLRGDVTCTFAGKYHLAWSMILADPNYFIPSAFIHFFMMFVPFFTIKPFTIARWAQGLILMGTGPMLASYITPNLHEQPAIWCFFSILQIASGLLVYGSKTVQNSKKQKIF